MIENQNSPLFADRYRFQTVGSDWDRGRSGLTHLVFDTKKERLGVIKRAELKSPQAVESLKNEVAALLDLKGEGVPEVYDTGEAEYGSKNYFYVVMEYIDGIRVEKNLPALSVPERVEILTQFFNLLAKSHQMGIVNGDVDLKHLFWKKDKKRLFVIDWGNAKIDVDLKKKTEFAYDLARSAEIIYSLVTKQGRPAATGTIALPDQSKLIPGLPALPVEFRNLCKWAPRTPADGAQSPYTAQELLTAAKDWQKAVRIVTATNKWPNWGLRLLMGFIILAAVFLISPLSPLPSLIYPKTETPSAITPTTSPVTVETAEPSNTPLPPPTSTSTPTLTLMPTFTPTLVAPPTSTPTPTSAITPNPHDYNDFTAKVFDKLLAPDNCWTNSSNAQASIQTSEGFAQREDKNWLFKIEKDRPYEDFVQADFNKCLDIHQQIEAVALNIWVQRLELQRNSPDIPNTIDPGREFGIFVEDANGQRREYTIWIDKDKLMHLRVREDKKTILDEVVLIVNKDILGFESVFPRTLAFFPIQFFFEIDNQGLDIIYLQEGSGQKPVIVQDINPNQMVRIDSAVYPTLGDVTKIGLIGYGGETQIVIWPLVFWGK